MNWFKHDTKASTDARLKKLIIKHGVTGYAIYFHCLELIAGDVSETNITFELEHDAEIIADNLKIAGTQDKSAIMITEDIMHYIVELGLFEEHDGHIFCYKLLKRLDSSMTSSSKFRSMISNAKGHHDKVMIRHDKVMQDKNRIDKKRTDNPKENDSIFYECEYFTVTNSLFSELKTIFAGKTINYQQEFTKMKIWLDDNPKRRKTKYKTFITNWLSKTYEKAQPPRPATTFAHGDGKREWNEARQIQIDREEQLRKEGLLK